MISYPNVKLNLGLHVLRKRPDGYHDLETLFVPYMGISDVLELNEAPEDSIEIQGGAWDIYTDLCWRALGLVKADFDIPPVRIDLLKRAPVGAGLGSGSSDAAFTLKMLNSMFSLGLSDDALAGYAARIGSDCAFFIYNTPMMGKGRGEVLAPFDIDLSAYEFKVGIPAGVSVSTREAYSGIVPRDRCGLAGGTSLREILSLPVEQWKNALVNDFEKTVFAVHPEIEALKESFYDSGAVYAAMSGSGSSVFGIFRK